VTKCAACGSSIAAQDGISLWDMWYCSTCFIGNAAKLHRELRPEDLAALKNLGRELAGYLPPELIEMLAVGFYRRSTGRKDDPPADELARFVGEIQRLHVLSECRKMMKFLTTCKSEFEAVVEQQYAEMRETIKRMTDFE
jgi:hypothetical protein